MSTHEGLFKRRYRNGAVVQGGMGVRVIGPRGAAEIMRSEVDQGPHFTPDKRGNVATLSETAMGIVLTRMLQDGDMLKFREDDDEGMYRWALGQFPNQDMVKQVLKDYYQPDGKRPDGQALLYRNPEAFRLDKHSEIEMLTVMGVFCDTIITRRINRDMGLELQAAGYDVPTEMGTLATNGLMKIDRSIPAGVYGAMLAEVVCKGWGADVTVKGAGNPGGIRDLVDTLYDNKPVDFGVKVVGKSDVVMSFDPRPYNTGNQQVSHPEVWGIVTEADTARALKGRVDAFVIESRLAGGHNGPGPVNYDTDGYPIRWQEFNDIDTPLIHAGGVASWGLAEAIKRGAVALQAGSIFAFTDESEIGPKKRKDRIVDAAVGGRLRSHSEVGLSPTGFPFWVAELDDTAANPEIEQARKAMCNDHVLEQAYVKPDGEIGYRCLAAPGQDVEDGKANRFRGKINLAKAAVAHCLCSELLATAGVQQRNLLRGTKDPEVDSLGGKGPQDIRGVVETYGRPFTTRKVVDYIKSGAGAEKAKKVARIDVFKASQKS